MGQRYRVQVSVSNSGEVTHDDVVVALGPLDALLWVAQRLAATEQAAPLPVPPEGIAETLRAASTDIDAAMAELRLVAVKLGVGL